MVESSIIELAHFFKDQLQSNGLKISQMIVFGSQASGVANQDSDVDLAIISDDFAGKTLFERVPLIFSARKAVARKFLRPLDVLLMTPQELTDPNSIKAQYVREGVVVS